LIHSLDDINKELYNGVVIQVAQTRLSALVGVRQLPHMQRSTIREPVLSLDSDDRLPSRRQTFVFEEDVRKRISLTELAVVTKCSNPRVTGITDGYRIRHDDVRQWKDWNGLPKRNVEGQKRAA
jgi:hypothetical protein